MNTSLRISALLRLYFSLLQRGVKTLGIILLLLSTKAAYAGLSTCNVPASVPANTPFNVSWSGTYNNPGYATVSIGLHNQVLTQYGGNYQQNGNVDLPGKPNGTYDVQIIVYQLYMGKIQSNLTTLCTQTIVIGNTPPSITPPAYKTTTEDQSTGPLAFSVSDQQTNAASLTVTATSNNQSLVPDANITLTGGANRTVTVVPAADANGSAVITLKVSDGVYTTNGTFTVQVSPVNDAPTISVISNQNINLNTATADLSFTIDDIDTPLANLIITPTSNNTALIPNSSISLGGINKSRTVRVTPTLGQWGSALITLTVSDGSLTKTSSFTVTVNAPSSVPAPSSSSISFSSQSSLASSNLPVGSSLSHSSSSQSSSAYLMPPAFANLTIDSSNNFFKIDWEDVSAYKYELEYSGKSSAASIQLAAGGTQGWAQPFIQSISATSGTPKLNNADGVAGAIGVAGRGTTTWDDDEIQNGESLTLSFGAPVSEANFGFAKLDYNLSAGHQIGLWVALLNGVEVGRGEFQPTDTTRTGTVQVKVPSGNSIAFDQLRFEPAKQGSDYVITSFNAVRSANNAETIGTNWYVGPTVYSGSSTTVLKSSVTDFAVYQWRVRACNSGNICSSWITTNEVTANAGDSSSASSMRSSSSSSSAALPSVTSLIYPATDVDGSFSVSWSSVLGAVFYQLEQIKTGGTWLPVYSGSERLYAALVDPGAYTYRVKACLTPLQCSVWTTGSAPIVVSGRVTPSVSEIIYIHTDALGSPAAETNKSGKENE